ncbi:MAG: ATPase [Acidobacteria bacterium]|nr:MAG: ATPase [Acidobacteriota bacterium]
MDVDIKVIHERVKLQSAFVESLKREVQKVIVGQDYMIDRILIGILSQGHILLEGVPGLAKTLTVKTFAKAIDTGFQRVQFTPDLLPADLIGTMIFDQKSSEFVPHKGPIFSNIILADEINRAPAKVQSALLEAMQERQVSIGSVTFALDDPFLVLATENPIEQEGTYPLPEAQVDRFMLKLLVTYPNKKEEKQILERMSEGGEINVKAVIQPKDIFNAREVVNLVYMDEKVKDYIVDLVFATRQPEDYGLEAKDLIQYGASPRATIFLSKAAKAHAFMNGRGYVTPEDVKSVGLDVLRHRIILTYEAEAENVTPEEVIRRVFDKVVVP